ncbi:reverse transcriptase domain-containing protein [Tanacetum coccineum]|uniref:Reverse transcriptase domain-containing protein n=1 Tax=Tanacetum coccineum TaxID=301880 RepID=A0ABQ5A5I6_9ASTR
MFTPLIKTPKEILAMETVKFKAPSLMSGLVESQNKHKFCEFSGDKGHSTDECIHVQKQIEEAVKSGQLSHLIKELKQGGNKGEHAKAAKKGKTPQQRKSHSDLHGPTLAVDNKTKSYSKFLIEDHLIHRMYVDGGSASEVLYEHCFNKLRPEVKSQMTLATAVTPPKIYVATEWGGARWCDEMDADGGRWYSGSGCCRSWWWRWQRVEARGGGDRIDRVMRNVFGLGRKSFPVAGGGAGAAVVVAGKRERDGAPLLGFSGEISWPLGQISLMVSSGDGEHSASALMNFMVGRSPSPYNGIIGRPSLRKVQAVPSTAHGMLKFLVKWGIVTLHNNTIIPAECRMVVEAPNELPPNESVASEGIKVATHPEYPEQTVIIGGSLSEKRRMELCDVLKSNLDIFAWKPADMTGVPRSITEHRLNVRKGCPPIRKVATFFQNLEELHKKERFSLDARGKKAFPDMKQCIVELSMPHPSDSGSKLKLNGKVSASPGACLKKVEKIFPSTPDSLVADFIAKIPNEDGPPMEIQVEETIPDPWTLFTDGSSCLEGSRVGLILTSPEGIEFTYALRFEFEASNNEAEYEALVAGLHIAEQMGVQNLEAKADSRLVANQINGSYIAKEQSMIQYLEKARAFISRFTKFSIEQVPRSENKKADALSKIASTSFAHLTKQVLVEVLKEKSIEEHEILAVVEEEGDSWMTPLLEYLRDGTLPAEVKRAQAIKIKSRQYVVIGGVLYRKSFLEPWLRCVGPLQAEYVVREIHEGSCSMHSGPRSVVAKTIRLGYYWPTMHRDVQNIIRKCDDCQVHRPKLKERFGLPGEIISDNGKQFRDNMFQDWCDKLNIKQRFASVKHPQTNEQVEIGMPSLRCTKIDQAMNDETLLLNLDVLEEEREKAVIQEAKSKAKMEKYYNAKVRNTIFRPGDFVYRNNEANHAKETRSLAQSGKDRMRS